MRWLLALLALLAVGATSPSGTRPSAQATGVGATVRPAIGIHPGSPDAVVLGDQLIASAAEARAAGAKYLHFYRSVNELSASNIATIMGWLGHPVVINVTVWNLDSLNTSGLPAACASDWTAAGCRNAIVTAITSFAQRHLEPGDILLIGNEQNEYFDTAADEIDSHTELVVAVAQALKTFGVLVGPALAHETSKEAVITSMWDDRFPILALNGYGETGTFTVGDPLVDGIGALDDMEAFALTLTRSWGINETGWPTEAAAGGSEGEQLTWAAAVRTWMATSTAQFLNVFIGLDGRLTSCTDETCPCFNAATNLGGNPGSDASESFICSMGLQETDGTNKDGWNALWGL